MTIQLNGKDHPLDAQMNIQSLLISISLGEKPVVVELNQQALFPREYANSPLKEGDQVEVITISAGG